MRMSVDLPAQGRAVTGETPPFVTNPMTVTGRPGAQAGSTRTQSFKICKSCSVLNATSDPLAAASDTLAAVTVRVTVLACCECQCASWRPSPGPDTGRHSAALACCHRQPQALDLQWRKACVYTKP